MTKSKSKSKSKSDKPRKRIRKPKYLSLHHLHRSTTTTAAADHQNHLINLFPTQTGTTKTSTSTSTASPPDDKDHDNNMAHFFSAADSCTTTLTGLLTAPTSSLSPEINEPGSPTSISAYSGRDSSLARTALRSREREEEEEEEIRWVRLSEVVGERKAAEEEVSSRAVAEGEEVWWLARRREGGGGGGGGLSLKLDYKEVSEAWCGIGRPFWRVAGAGVDDTPQTVPDLQLVQDDLNVANGGLWRVPNHTSYVGYGKEEDGGEAIEVPKVRQREASVLRYKEKRMNRLFSKQIRYQVRKLNAEKRPRVKGRFVKRS